MAFGALLFTLLGVAVDVASNVVTVLSTKRDMAELEDEAAQAGGGWKVVAGFLWCVCVFFWGSFFFLEGGKLGSWGLQMFVRKTFCSCVLMSFVFFVVLRTVGEWMLAMKDEFGWSQSVFFSPTAESFGVLAKLSPGALWGSHPARFWQVPRFQVRVPSKGSGRFRGSK